MNQQSVDDLLAQVQTQAAAVSQAADPTSNSSTNQHLEIPGDMEPPGSKAPAPALAGEFAPPPTSKRALDPATAEFQRLLAIEVPVIVRLGQRRMSVSEVMRMSVGAILEFHKPADEDLELLANNQSVGQGHAVKVGENFGLKISAMGPVRETIRKLGGG